MESRQFKKLFNETATSNGFENVFDGWFKESKECILVLDLQKSNFASNYYLNIKIYIQGIFGNNYVKSKELVKKDVGDIFTRQPNAYDDVFRLDNSMGENERKARLEELFNLFILPFTDKALSKSGIKELAEKGEIFLLPAVKEELA